jgi:VIT1/CCC1 family predicted Fe2+/Mn2+ transporter
MVPAMVKQGPVPAFVHGLYEYLAGALLIAAPLLIGYDHGAATAVSIVLGVLVVFLAATTDVSTSLVNQISLPAHIALDYVLVAVLIGSPFLFGFSDETAPTGIFIAGGVLHLLVSIGTRYRKEEPRETREPAEPRPTPSP